MPTFEDYLRELELLDISRQLGRVPPGSPAAVAAPQATTTRHQRAATVMSHEEGITKPVRAAVIPSVTVDPARASRISAMDWTALIAETATCSACTLCKQRKQAVFGVGAKAATWLFVGEGPGAEEDEQGEPFVGQAGKLLDAMLAAIALKRGREVYIANVVKCRPPGNRTPTSDEAAACAPLLDRQIDLIQPKLIVALGKTAVVRLTGTDASMASMRGAVHRYRGIPVVATYHPAYLLRSLSEKLKAWEDMLLARQEMMKQGAIGPNSG